MFYKILYSALFQVTVTMKLTLAVATLVVGLLAEIGQGTAAKPVERSWKILKRASPKLPQCPANEVKYHRLKEFNKHVEVTNSTKSKRSVVSEIVSVLPQYF